MNWKFKTDLVQQTDNCEYRSFKIHESMRIIAWNCQGAFRKKAEFILASLPDILIVAECEHPDKLKFKSGIPSPTDRIWCGNNSNKGLAVFSYNNFKLKLIDLHNPNFKTILPISVKGGRIDFTLFAIWANNPKDPDGRYITQIWKALECYKTILKRKPIILAGDFNSNAIWDRPSRKDNHVMLVEHLERINIHSVYHSHYQQMHGKEEHPTFFLHRNRSKPYHLDYCFASAQLMDKSNSVEIGTYDNWRTLSDHAPVTVVFDTLK
jgi:exodeoxyribonuclease III